MVDLGCVLTEYVQDPCFEATLKNIDQSLNGKAFGSSFASNFSIPATGALPPFCKRESNRLVLKRALRLLLLQQVFWSRQSRAALYVILFDVILPSFKRYFWGSRGEHISFLLLKEQNLQALPP